MHIISCTEERHAAAILAIFNDAILNSTALYEYQPRTLETMAAWFAAKRAHGYPVIGVEDAAGVLLGFASYGAFRGYPANKYSVEHSIYVQRDQRGNGLGRILLGELIAVARREDVHVLVGAVDAANEASAKLHESLGFAHCGTIRHAAFKFGRWLDLAFYQLILETPARPVDG
ncbi:N-acetyltransferase family protein [Janthinobacterium sp.]|uniref:GNAT family N-acetyltransferase n=1 Tax=Janthinobacterium sp. TaxID=1871054 RepID=UPI00293D319F|nr:N-acetyltransferase family protein [Janthinobacterium sp.]